MSQHEDIVQLAHLMRLGAETARTIAEAQPALAEDLLKVALRADALAAEIEMIGREGGRS